MDEISTYPEAVNVLHAKLTAPKPAPDGPTLFEWITERRTESVSWRTIRDELRDNTGIKLPDVTLIRWYAEAGFEDPKTSVAA